MPSAVSDSLIATPSFIHMLGYSAAMPAAIRPARSPATARPSSPIITTAPVPTSAIVNRWAMVFSPASMAAGVATSAVRGGWSAASPPVKGRSKPSPWAITSACRL